MSLKIGVQLHFRVEAGGIRKQVETFSQMPLANEQQSEVRSGKSGGALHLLQHRLSLDHPPSGQRVALCVDSPVQPLTLAVEFCWIDGVGHANGFRVLSAGDLPVSALQIPDCIVQDLRGVRYVGCEVPGAKYLESSNMLSRQRGLRERVPTSPKLRLDLSIRI